MINPQAQEGLDPFDPFDPFDPPLDEEIDFDAEIRSATEELQRLVQALRIEDEEIRLRRAEAVQAYPQVITLTPVVIELRNFAPVNIRNQNIQQKVQVNDSTILETRVARNTAHLLSYRRFIVQLAKIFYQQSQNRFTNLDKSLKDVTSFLLEKDELLKELFQEVKNANKTLNEMHSEFTAIRQEFTELREILGEVKEISNDEIWDVESNAAINVVNLLRQVPNFTTKRVTEDVVL